MQLRILAHGGALIAALAFGVVIGGHRDAFWPLADLFAVRAEATLPTKSALPVISSALRGKCIEASAPIADQFGNNHDAIYLPGTDDSAYRHYLLISGEQGIGQLYGAQKLGKSPSDWKLIDPKFFVANEYEFDDGLLIDDRYYIFENRRIYSYEGDLKDSSRKWKLFGSFPNYIDDIGVYYDGEAVHVFGEYGRYEGGYDGKALAYLTTTPEFRDWTIVNLAILNPNTLPGSNWGVGDPSVIVKDGRVVMVTDIEGLGEPYRIALWEAEAFGRSFNFAGILAKAASGTAGYNNYRVQDGEFAVDEKGDIFMFSNWMDADGTPGHTLPHFKENWTRVVGGYSCTISLVERDSARDE